MLGKLISLSGPSGVGKTSIITSLVDDAKRYCRILVYTTRPRRWYESQDRDYHFISKQQLRELIRQDRTVEETLVEFHGHQFAISLKEIEEVIKTDRSCLIELYIDRIPTLKRQFGKSFYSIFLIPPSLEILSFRLSKFRKHSNAFVEKRINQAKQEIISALGPMKYWFNKVITLDDQLDRSIIQTDTMIKEILSISSSINRT